MTMIQKIKAPITVLSIFNHKTGRMVPKLLRWDGKPYEIKIGEFSLDARLLIGLILFVYLFIFITKRRKKRAK